MICLRGELHAGLLDGMEPGVHGSFDWDPYLHEDLGELLPSYLDTLPDAIPPACVGPPLGFILSNIGYPVSSVASSHINPWFN